jgi:long-chain acyl-CoA synthetase
MHGYWKREEETNAAFCKGWLRTGDLGKMDADGYFYVVERAKDVINASGFKVYPREVEEILFQHPAVAEAAVVV